MTDSPIAGRVRRSRAAPLTEAEIRRFLRASKKEGFDLVGYQAGGLMLVGSGLQSLAPVSPSDDNAKWQDVEA